jgi:hypothetical protein
MHSSKRILLSAAGLLVAIAVAGTAAAANATSYNPTRHPQRTGHPTSAWSDSTSAGT